MSWAPYIHPSGQYVIFASNKLGFENFELFMVDIDGKKEPVRVTYSDGFDGLPVPSPDGKQLAWTTSRGGGREGQIFLAQWNHDAALAAIRNAPQRTSDDVTNTSDRGIEESRLGRVRLGSVLGARCCPGWLRHRLLGADGHQRHRRARTSRRWRRSGSGGARRVSDGERLAGDYIAAQLARVGAKPLPGKADMFLPFEFTAGSRDGGSKICDRIGHRARCPQAT